MIRDDRGGYVIVCDVCGKQSFIFKSVNDIFTYLNLTREWFYSSYRNLHIRKSGTHRNHMKRSIQNYCMDCYNKQDKNLKERVYKVFNSYGNFQFTEKQLLEKYSYLVPDNPTPKKPKEGLYNKINKLLPD